MELTTLHCEPRRAAGSRANARLRRSGKVPGIVYGHGEEPIPVAMARHDLEQLLHHGAHLLELHLGGTTQRVLIKEVQYDHLGVTPIHVDLARVSLDERVRVTVPLELRGEPKGVREGGILDQNIAELDIECLVTQIPENIRVNIADMGLDQMLYVKDIQVPEGVRVLTSPELVVCSIRKPLEEAPAAEPTEAAAAEPELIRKERPAEEEEETKS